MSQNIAYSNLVKNESFAELIGVILGDGSLYKHPRTENLRIICNAKEALYIKHISYLVQRVFNKKPSSIKRKSQNAVNINLYQRKICERLNMPWGDKIKNNVRIPSWVFARKEYRIKCLKGLFETDGCFQEDKDNYAQYLEFKNNCKKLNEDVYNILKNFGFHPQFGSNYIRLARRGEVYRFKDLISFRDY